MAVETGSELITVGLPVYNAMPYLPEAIESVLQQSMPHVQVLAIVDGATDGSLEYLHTIRDARLRVMEQQQCGLTYTLNRMLRECNTPWLVRQDADDVSTPGRLATITQAIQAHPEAGMFYSHAAYHPHRRSVGLYRCTQGTPDQIRLIARSGYLPAICHPSAALNVQKTLAIGGYRPGIQCEDADLWWRMALAHDIHFIPEVLLLYRQNANSLTSRNLEQQALHGLYVQYLLLSQLQSRTPERLCDVEEELRGLLKNSSLRAKEKLRLFNMHLGQGERQKAARALLAAVCASPKYVIQRLLDEYFPVGTISNGVEPRLFQQRKESLWPQHSSA